MSVFADYSGYYDLLYKDKDYQGEADYVDRLIKKHIPGSKSILDLGCGTGNHDFLFARKGYEVTGVDMSEDMLARANKKRLSADAAGLKINFHHGDIRTVSLPDTYDVVLSLFHVMSYQTADRDLQAAFNNASRHLRKGGVFIFDCWYGPAVLTDRPSVRVKRLENEDIAVTRIAEPVMHPNENLVDVNYHVFITEKAGGTVTELKETHPMRYLFKPEIESFMTRAGLQLIGCGEWMTDKEPGFTTWGVYFVGKYS